MDEIELSGPPDTLVIGGKASDMRGSGKITRNGSWESVSLASIVNDVAAQNGWQPVCPVTALVLRADQLSESDFNFIITVECNGGKQGKSKAKGKKTKAKAPLLVFEL